MNLLNLLTTESAEGHNPFSGLRVGLPQLAGKRSIRNWSVRQTDECRQSKIFISEWSRKRTEEVIRKP